MLARRFLNLRALTVLALALAKSGEAYAEEGEKCISSFETAQRLRKEGKLLAASEALITCSDPSCQNFISKECTAWYTEVQASLPTVALSAKRDGQVLRGVRVYVDGVPVSERNEGRSIPVDPGLREFRFEVDGLEPLTVKELIIEGEKNKPIAAVFPGEMKPEGESSVTPGPSTEAPNVKPAASGPPIGVYLLAGAGVLALGGGVALRVIGSNEFDDFESSCKPRCNQDEVDKTILKYTLSDISLGVGAAALIGASVLYLVDSNAEKTSSQTGFTVAPSNRGASAFWSGRF